MLTYTFKKGSDAAVDFASFPMDDVQSHNYKVHVEKTTGLFGKPSLKSVEAFDWKYLHGVTPDLHNRRYQSKEIQMSCWIEADSKQQAIYRYNSVVEYFSYDDLIFMKTTWADDMDYGGVIPSPNPWSPKGLFALVWLKSARITKHKLRKGRNIICFTLVFEDPYPMKRVYRYGGTELDGIIYDIVSDTEIDIYLETGEKLYDILNETGRIACQQNNTHILVCGDVVHATNTDLGDELIMPANSGDTVTEIYSEI